MTSPGMTFKLIILRISCPSGRYRKITSSNSICPWIGGKLLLLPATSVRAFKISPSRCTEMPVCWKSVHNCARRITGWATCPASILNATSCPTDNFPSITSLAPIYMVATVTNLLIKVTPLLASMPRVAVRKLAAIYAARFLSHFLSQWGSTAIALTVWMPLMVSTKKDWFSAPRLNFSFNRTRNKGVKITDSAI